ncbi:MAG TPA: glycoside hydrolase family 15 protein [Labilithrix sp.]|jgi:GH15 family glucan-1,4-alpha-glucosidase|nr:glycoside hydrolase family 15 protein [Labilithrix sp.]
MDLVTIARRLGRPFVLRGGENPAELPIAARGMIGNGSTVALVAVDGAIDWLCMPRFDSPSVFARILDSERGGSMTVRPTARPLQSLQHYDPDTNVLETVFIAERGTLRVVDFMPWSDDPRASIHEVHRRIDCASGAVETEIIFDPRFDYAQDVPTIHLTENGALAEGKNGERLSLSVSLPLEFSRMPDGGVRATVTLKPGVHLWCVLAWRSERVEPAAAHRPYEHLRVTRRKWREWSAQLTYDGPWRHQVLRSALALKLLVYRPTGAVVAAPTTSLPEWPGGQRNWDYRYTWARDAAMTIRATNLIGFGAEAREFYHFLRDSVDPGVGLELMYTVDGLPVPEERELAHLAGSMGARPVRIGNGARDQIQLDTTGAIVDSAQMFEYFGGTLTLDAWHKLESVIERATTQWREPDHGMWEPRHGVRHNVHSKLMNWLAMDRGAHLATSFGRADLADRWSACATEIHADICEKGMDAERQHFVSVYGEERPDAALLLLSTLGFLPDDDPRLAATIDWVRRELGTGHFVYRYHGADGVGGAEGAFILCGFWLAEALALLGRLDEAREVFVAHAEAANHVGLLAEEIDPSNLTLLGNFPQAFSHLGLLNAALRIDLGLRLRNEGSSRGPHLIGGPGANGQSRTKLRSPASVRRP